MTALLVVQVEETDADDERLAQLAAGLRAELRNLDVESVDQLTEGEAPPGTRGVELAAIGALVVQLKPVAVVVASVISAVRSWASRSPSDRRVRLEMNGRVLELSGATASQQERLVQEFLASLGG